MIAIFMYKLLFSIYRFSIAVAVVQTFDLMLIVINVMYTYLLIRMKQSYLL